MYCMYAHVCCMYCMYWPRQARIPAQRPQKAPRWGGTPRAPLRVPLGRWQTTFSGHRGSTPGPVLAHPGAQHSAPLRSQKAFHTHFALGEPAPSPIRDDLGRYHCAEASRAAATAARNPLQTLMAWCMYVYVCVCIQWYLYALYVSCVYLISICMYCMYWPRQARMPALRPQKTPRWGGTPLAPLRAPLGRWQITFSDHRGPTPGPVLAHPGAHHSSGGPKCTPCAAKRHSTRISRSASQPRATSEMIWVGGSV